MREHIVSLLADDCLHYGALLHAFCVMEHHIHLMLRTPLDHDAQWFMQRFKSNSAKTLLPLLTAEERDQLTSVSSTTRSFWKASLRGIMVTEEEKYWKCITYIHLNPDRAGFCERIEDYRWSSGWMYEQCLWTEEGGVTEAACREFPRTLPLGWVR
jgi:REP element-mobilizing transposase RayT